MKVLSIIFMLLLAILPGSAQKKNSVLPDHTGPGSAGYLDGNLIFSMDSRPTPQCHASTIVETGVGIVAAWFGGTREKDSDVGIWVSRLVKGGWTHPVEMANGIQNDSVRYPCWNPVLFQPDNGALLLFYKVGPSPREWWGEMMSSEDSGQSWSTPRKLGKGRLGHLLGPVKNKPVQLQDGSILCPSSTEIIIKGEVYWRVHFELTRDMGMSWELVGPINEGVEFDAIQPSILTYQDGRLQILCRTRQEVISESWSKDGGRNWSSMSATHLPNPNAGTDAVTLVDGRQLLVYNHSTRAKKSPGRQLLNVAVSDDGIMWEPVMTLENQKGEYSYPAVIQSSDGLVHITYTYDRKSIKHVVLDPKEIYNQSDL